MSALLFALGYLAGMGTVLIATALLSPSKDKTVLCDDCGRETDGKWVAMWDRVYHPDCFQRLLLNSPTERHPFVPAPEDPSRCLTCEHFEMYALHRKG
ncbi:hypothetical protein [Rhodococcus koreensis]